MSRAVDGQSGAAKALHELTDAVGRFGWHHAAKLISERKARGQLLNRAIAAVKTAEERQIIPALEALTEAVEKSRWQLADPIPQRCAERAALLARCRAAIAASAPEALKIAEEKLARAAATRTPGPEVWPSLSSADTTALIAKYQTVEHAYFVALGKYPPKRPAADDTQEQRATRKP